MNPAGLTKNERQELIDLLRKNFLYQQPAAAFSKDDPAPDLSNPAFLVLRMIPGHWERMLELLHKAGGWVMPDVKPVDEVVQ